MVSEIKSGVIIEYKLSFYCSSCNRSMRPLPSCFFTKRELFRDYTYVLFWLTWVCNNAHLLPEVSNVKLEQSRLLSLSQCKVGPVGSDHPVVEAR